MCSESFKLFVPVRAGALCFHVTRDSNTIINNKTEKKIIECYVLIGFSAFGFSSEIDMRAPSARRGAAGD